MLNPQNIFPIGIGSWGVGGFRDRDEHIDKSKQVDAIAYMLQKGMNYLEANLWYSEGYSVEILAEALNKSGKKREDVFICQAVYLKNNTLEDVEQEVEQVCKLFHTNYVDTFQFTMEVFLKYPFDKVCKTVDMLFTKKKIRYTSITNENLSLLKQYHQRFGNQLFSHEVCYNFEIRANEQEGTIQYAKDNDIRTVVFQPLRRNRTANRNWPLLVKLSQKYNITQNQVILSWILSKGFLPLTKSETKAHIDEHINALKIKLEKEDILALDQFSPPQYQSPVIDWNNSGQGVHVSQLSNVFDENYDKQHTQI